jgi:Ran GTPase-activating protein (RanGAP) involved in mRNA processing and transport
MAGAKALEEIAAGKSTIDLGWKGLGAADVAAFAEALAVLDGRGAVEELSLWGSELGDEGAAAVAAIIAALPGLRVLNVDSCGMGPEGVLVVTAAIATAPQIQKLVLSNNEIGATAAGDVARRR